MKDFIPILKAEPREDFEGGLKVWCPFCLVYHLHGIGEGHRAAHCAILTPFREHGYYIALDPEKFRKKERIRVPKIH